MNTEEIPKKPRNMTICWLLRNISNFIKVPNTIKLMKPRVLLLFSCLKTLVKLESRVFEMASQRGIISFR